MEKSRESMSPTEFFNMVKSNKEASTLDAELERYYTKVLKMLDKAIKTGQKRQVALLRQHYDTVVREQEIRAMGIDTFVYTTDVETYIKKVKNRVVKLADLEDYPREVPDDVVTVIEQVQGKFDRLIVMFTDYTDALGQEIAKAERDKDPILFGVFIDEVQEYVSERMYYLADWEDEYCDLTLDQLVKENKDITNTDIVYYSETANADELLSLAESYNEDMRRKTSKMVVSETPSVFSKVRSWITRGK